MASKLDYNRPFQTALGIVKDDEVFYFQDGKEFYPDGTEAVKTPEPTAVEIVPEPAEIELEAVAPQEPVVATKTVKKTRAKKVVEEAILEAEEALAEAKEALAEAEEPAEVHDLL